VLSQNFLCFLAARDVHEGDHDTIDFTVQGSVGAHTHDERGIPTCDLHLSFDHFAVAQDAHHVFAEIAAGDARNDLVEGTAAIRVPEVKERRHRRRVTLHSQFVVQKDRGYVSAVEKVLQVAIRS
jgi:hypothetical protein